MIENAAGNLIEAPVDALVNTVNCVGIMGKGIALQFKQAFPEMAKAYEAACLRGEVEPGRMHVWESETPLTPPRYIINFPTKRHWRGKSRMADIESGLVALAAEIERLGIRSVAIPPLGCGLGGLNWNDVRPRIEKAMARLSKVRILIYPPAGAPAVDDRVVNTAKVPLNATRAALLVGVRRYAVLGFSISMLEVQKVAYFLQEIGVLSNLRYKKAHYGPYADNLNHVLGQLEGHYVHGYDGDRKPTKALELDSAGLEEAEKFLATEYNTQDGIERVTKLIEGFETPYGMELLASVHWVAKHEEATSKERSVERVQAWSERKRKILEAGDICIAWQQLAEQGWIASESVRE